MNQEPSVIKIYPGNQTQAMLAFQADSAMMATQGYAPTSQTWVAGSHGCGTFLVALVLCVIGVGIFIFFYLLMVPPPGNLSVTYELRAFSGGPVGAFPEAEKTCPKCAERVRVAASVCRYCGYNFAELKQLPAAPTVRALAHGVGALSQSRLRVKDQLGAVLFNDLIPPAGFVIGRDQSICQIVLPDATVSRSHATLTWQGQQLIVVDKSSSGTFDGSQKISPNTAYHWTGSNALRIGPYSLWLE